MALTKPQVVDWLMRCGEVFSRERDFLTQLDTEIGDADHGVNLERGFQAVLKNIGTIADMAPGPALNEVGRLLVMAVGGASGPLYGTFFMTLGKQLGEDADISHQRLVAACDEALSAISVT